MACDSLLIDLMTSYAFSGTSMLLSYIMQASLTIDAVSHYSAKTPVSEKNHLDSKTTFSSCDAFVLMLTRYYAKHESHLQHDSILLS